MPWRMPPYPKGTGRVSRDRPSWICYRPLSAPWLSSFSELAFSCFKQLLHEFVFDGEDPGFRHPAQFGYLRKVLDRHRGPEPNALSRNPGLLGYISVWEPVALGSQGSNNLLP